MPLTKGIRLGSYEVVDAIGAGGMGEVYRARDTKLNRDVAIKVLPESFAKDAERLARFRREAQTLAALNHPHIAQIHGLEESNNTSALVMELVDGEDLSMRLKRGPIPLDEALPIARQIAEALEAAHEQGIVHRDLKPANIKVREDGTVKVLDFGLAKATAPRSMEAEGFSPRQIEAANSPTITSPAMTLQGVIMGTAAYMSPEQAKGRAVDRRTDIGAFGCVLYEMLTGSRAFDGEDTTEILGAIVKTEPDWSRLPAETPPVAITLLRRCLQKDPRKRQQHIDDARIEIDEIANTPVSVKARSRSLGSFVPWAVAALMAAVAIVVLMYPKKQSGSAETREVIQFDIPMAIPRQQARLSPDGRMLVYFAPGAGGRLELWLRELSKPAPERLGDGVTLTLGGHTWAPDSSSFYLFQPPSTFRRFDVRTRSNVAQPMTAEVNMLNPGRGGVVLAADGRFVVGASTYSPFSSLQLLIPERLTPLLPLDSSVQEVRQTQPGVIGTDRISYASVRADGSTQLCVIAIQDPRPQCAGPLNHSSRAYYYDGWIVFARGQTLLARHFDPDRVAFTSDEQVIADNLVGSATTMFFEASNTGVLMFRTGSGTERLAWRVAGEGEKPIREIVSTTNMTLSPDGRRALVNERQTLVMLDLEGPAVQRIGPTSGDPVWAPDGRRFAHRSATGIAVRALDDARETVLMRGDNLAFTEDWSRDGRWIVVGMRDAPDQLALLPAAGGEPVGVLPRGGGLTDADEAHFSPDGKWLAFNAQSGTQHEVFVIPLPATGQRWQVSANGGVQARWHPSGRTLYFLDPEGKMMAAEISPGTTFASGVPRPLFDIGFVPSFNFDDYRVAPDGRFLLKQPVARVRFASSSTGRRS
jgi:serine/threonine protein kinase